MRFIKLTKRENELERCFVLWTQLFTLLVDFGSIICKGSDEFGLVIKYKAWGPVFYWGNRDIEKLGERDKFDGLQFTRIQGRYAEQRKRRIDSRDFFEHKEQLVREGKRKNPADMNYEERHAATMEAVKKMNFSAEFCHLMTTPVSKLALERGEKVEEWRYDSDGNKVNTGKILTDGWIEQDKQNYRRDYSLPGMASGVIGFKKSGEGYESIRVPAARQGEITSGVSQSLQLEDGQ